MNIVVPCEEAFIEVVYALVQKGLYFHADYATLTIKLTGVYQ